MERKKVKAGITDVASMVSSQHQGLAEGRVKDLIHEVFEAIMALAETNPKGVHLKGLGTFRWSEKKERIGRNPKTGEAVTVPAKRKFVFKSKTESKNKELVEA